MLAKRALGGALLASSSRALASSLRALASTLRATRQHLTSCHLTSYSPAPYELLASSSRTTYRTSFRAAYQTAFRATRRFDPQQASMAGFDAGPESLAAPEHGGSPPKNSSGALRLTFEQLSTRRQTAPEHDGTLPNSSRGPPHTLQPLPKPRAPSLQTL